MSFSHIYIFALLITGVASSDSCNANDKACLEDEGPDLSEFMQRAAAVKKLARNSLAMEQMSIDDMLDKVKSLGDKRVDGRLPADQNEQVKELKTLLTTSLLPSLTQVHDDAQQELYSLVGAISTCNANTSAIFTAIGGAAGPEATVNASRVSHANCRKDQATKLAAKNVAIQNMKDSVDKVQSGKDLGVPPPTSGADSHILYLTTIQSMYCGKREDLVLKKAVKDNATSEHEKLVTNCTNRQKSFEEDYCSWRAQLTEACRGLTLCYEPAAQAYATRSAAVQALVASWQTELTGINKILCYLDIWLSDDNVTTVNDEQLSECDKDVNTTSMQIQYPDAEAQGPCETAKVQEYPGSSGFNPSEYGGISTDFSNITTCKKTLSELLESSATTTTTVAT